MRDGRRAGGSGEIDMIHVKVDGRWGSGQKGEGRTSGQIDTATHLFVQQVNMAFKSTLLRLLQLEVKLFELLLMLELSFSIGPLCV